MTQPINTLEKRTLSKPCGIGLNNMCCKLCLMGPCQITKNKSTGVCGASLELIVARNILRFITGGASTHCGHALHVAKHLSKEIPDNYIAQKAPEYLYNRWKELGLLPHDQNAQHFIDISESLHLSTMGVDSDYQDVLKWCLKIALIDGYYGLALATDMEDQKIGKPKIKKASLNLGCIDPAKTNIAIHGHEPMLAMSIVEAAKNHPDINLVGVCCTGSTILAQAGIPLSAHFSLQEDVIATGVIDALVVDVHCIMPSVGKLCDCYHTQLITTNDLGRFPNALHMPVATEGQAKEIAEKIISIAKENRQNRNRQAEDLFQKTRPTPKEVAVGFSEYNIDIPHLAQQLSTGQKRGIIGVVGCVNPRAKDEWIAAYTKLSKDYIILTTGCMAFEFGKEELLDGEAIFHMGSCVNNYRIVEILKQISTILQKEIGELDCTISAPMPITEKSAAIGMFFAALGCDVHIGYPHSFASSDLVSTFLQNTLKDCFGNKLLFDETAKEFLTNFMPSTEQYQKD